MATTVHTGWREVTPGDCKECGSDSNWTCDGRGNVLCDCQACPHCGIVDAYGFHNPGCSVLEQRWEVSSEVFGRFPIFRREGLTEVQGRKELAASIRLHRQTGWHIRREDSLGDRYIYTLLKDGDRKGEIVLIQR